MHITSLKKNEVFVFGSNLAGRHGAGAALFAAKNFGAKYGVGEGITGQCYAIPTKDYNIQTLPLDHIDSYILTFLIRALKNPSLTFLVTEIGCGLAGYKTSEIKSLFDRYSKISNVVLPESFL